MTPRPQSPSRSRFPRTQQVLRGLARHLFAGLASAFALALLEGILSPGEVGTGPRALALLYLVGLLAPLGVLFALASSSLMFLFAPIRWLGPIRLGISKLGSSRPDARRFAGVFAALAGLLTMVLLSRYVVVAVQRQLHSSTIIRWAIALSTPVVLAASVIVAALVQHLITPIGRLLGRAGSPRGGVLMVVAFLIVVGFFVQERVLAASQGVVLAPFLAPVGALVFFVIALRWASRLERPERGAFAISVIALLGLVLVATTYGQSRPTRQFVEGHTATGQRLLRLYSRWTDRDNDGHSPYFGGHDCDDNDSRVHPNAADPAGDGVDSDCFGGDGGPPLEGVMGDGLYADLPAGSAESPNILIIMVDALRPDHLGALGYSRNTSPHIDAFANTAVVFEQAIASSSRSVRSIPSMFTGLYPGQIAFGGQFLYPAVLPENEMLAEVLSEAGYQTEACMGTDYFSRVQEFFQGFDEVDQGDPMDRGAPTRCATNALRRFGLSEDPYFLWVHLFNVHIPYLPDGRPSVFGEVPRGRYDTEIQFADREIQRILEATDDDTIVLLVSDHGEAFGEHGNQGHSTTLYEEEVGAVLMVRAPGVEPRRIDVPVTLADVAPTLRNLATVPGRPQIAGRSLVQLMYGRDDDSWMTRPLLMELLPDGMFPYDQKALRVGADKLIWWVRDGTTRFANLAHDPDELEDGWNDSPERAEQLFDMLRTWSAVARSGAQVDNVDEHLLDEMPDISEPLGYAFDGFEVVGYDPPEWSTQRGETIRMSFYYRVTGSIDGDLMFFVTLRDEQNAEFHDFHAQHYPINGTYRTPRWRPGQLIRDDVEIVVPHNVGLGKWTLGFAVYDDSDWTRRTFVINGDSRNIMELGEIDVQRGEAEDD